MMARFIFTPPLFQRLLMSASCSAYERRPPAVYAKPAFQFGAVAVARPCTDGEVSPSMNPTGQRFWSVAVKVLSVTAAAGTIKSAAVGVMDELNVVSMKPTPDAIDGEAVTIPNSTSTPPRIRAMGSPLRNRFER